MECRGVGKGQVAPESSVGNEIGPSIGSTQRGLQCYVCERLDEGLLTGIPSQEISRISHHTQF